MPQPTPLVVEIGRLMRVDRAARLLLSSALKRISDDQPAVAVDKLRYGEHGHIYIRVTGRQFAALWDAVHEKNERCPNIIYPERETDRAAAKLAARDDGPLDGHWPD